MTVEAPQLATCGSCGIGFELSARNVRACRQRGEEPKCHACRYPPRQPTEAELERLRRWWLQRYTREELEEIGRLIGWVTR